MAPNLVIESLYKTSKQACHCPSLQAAASLTISRMLTDTLKIDSTLVIDWRTPPVMHARLHSVISGNTRISQSIWWQRRWKYHYWWHATHDTDCTTVTLMFGFVKCTFSTDCYWSYITVTLTAVVAFIFESFLLCTQYNIPVSLYRHILLNPVVLC